MKIDYKIAQQLCTSTEFAIISSSKPAEVSSLPLQKVKKLLNQSSKLAAKWAEQAAKHSASGDDERAGRSSTKEKFFTEVLARYEKQLARLVASPPALETSSTAATPAASAPLPSDPSIGKVRPPTLAEQARDRGRGADFRTEVSGLNSRVKGHVSARGRRSEAARAARND